jgi:hypothetical protein
MPPVPRLPELKLPHHPSYDFGFGIDRLSGARLNLAVKNDAQEPAYASGAIMTFNVSRISSTSDLQQQLGIDLEASYGCATFGAGVSARFSFSESSAVHSSSLFMTVTATVDAADMSIGEVVLTDEAAKMVDNPDAFTARYGDTFLLAVKRGGLFIGLLRIETFDDKEAESISGELQGSYGLFSADAKLNFSKVASEHKVKVYCSLYSEGGPPLQIRDPTDPAELLEHANAWSAALADPKTYARPYEWTASPLSIAEGPLPPNAADIEHAQDVLKFCAIERAAMLDQLNELNWFTGHADMYDWSGADQGATAESARKTQTDLDTISACASHAINHPGDAKMPADFAGTLPAGTYPLSRPLPPAPKAKGAPAPPPPTPVIVPNLIGMWMPDLRDDPLPDPWPSIVADFQLNWVRGEPRTGSRDPGMIYQQDPAANNAALKGSTLTLTIYDDGN